MLLRKWAGLSKTGGTAVLSPLPSQISRSYVETLDIQASFMSKNKVTAEQFSMEEMAENFKRAHIGMVIAKTQMLILDFRSYTLQLVIKDLRNIDLSQSGGPVDQDAGILMEKTDIAFVSDSNDGSTAIKFKHTGNKCALPIISTARYADAR